MEDSCCGNFLILPCRGAEVCRRVWVLQRMTRLTERADSLTQAFTATVNKCDTTSKRVVSHVTSVCDNVTARGTEIDGVCSQALGTLDNIEASVQAYVRPEATRRSYEAIVPRKQADRSIPTVRPRSRNCKYIFPHRPNLTTAAFCLDVRSNSPLTLQRNYFVLPLFLLFLRYFSSRLHADLYFDGFVTASLPDPIGHDARPCDVPSARGAGIAQSRPRPDGQALTDKQAVTRRH